MITDLKQTLRDLRRQRMRMYSCSAYQKITKDLFFDNVPHELRKLWYSLDDLSFETLSIGYDSNIERMSHDELVRWIYNESCLIARFEKIFSDFETKKVGNAHGKN